jgi:predicted RNA-binding Zn ribbon-like protein
LLTSQKKPSLTIPLEFVNTVGWRESAAAEEHLKNYQDLLDWSHKQGVLDAQEYEKAVAEASDSPHYAIEVYRRALELREDLYVIFSALIEGSDPVVESLARFNQTLSIALSHLALVKGEAGYDLTIHNGGFLDFIPWRVAISASVLITSDKFDRVKRCAAEGCNWLFLDESKNRSRRWCDMNNCGNIMKARRHYARIRIHKREKINSIIIN